MPLSVPIAAPQFWLFEGFSLLFFALIIRAMMRRRSEQRGRRDTRSRWGIVLQTVGIGCVGLAPVRPTLEWTNLAALAAYLAIGLLMTVAVALFASSSAALGRNWSFEARTLADHRLIRSGPYA